MRKVNIIIIMFLMCVCINAHNAEAKTTEYATVKSVHKGTVSVVDDRTGNVWEFYGDGFRKGDRVVCTVAKGNRIVDAHKLSDRQLVRDWCRKHFRNYKIKFVKENDSRIWHRMSKRTIYVEKVTSISRGGRHGTTRGGFCIGYNINVRRGKRITSYVIWNPRNNVCDDVLAVVDNGRIR